MLGEMRQLSRIALQNDQKISNKILTCIFGLVTRHVDNRKKDKGTRGSGCMCMKLRKKLIVSLLPRERLLLYRPVSPGEFLSIVLQSIVCTAFPSEA